MGGLVQFHANAYLNPLKIIMIEADSLTSCRVKLEGISRELFCDCSLEDLLARIEEVKGSP
jgi:hypothetical protein